MNENIKKILNKKNKSKLVCLTAYSKNIASILDKHCDIVLVGDSLGSVLYNYKSTKEVSLNTMISHSRSVRLGVKKSLMVVDMPFNTYRNPKEALKNAKLVMKKTKCDAVKLEGGKKILSIVKKLVKNKDLWIKLDDLCEKNKVSWKWVKGHSSNKYNNLADELATQAIEN